MSASVKTSVGQHYDQELQDIADYALNFSIDSQEAWKTSLLCLMDTLGCGFAALQFPQCTKHLGPIVPGTLVPGGSRVPGTSYRLDPGKSAWDITCMNRWLDYNDCWAAAEWAHPSDNLGCILAVADFVSQKLRKEGKQALVMRDVLESMIIAYEIQGCLGLQNSFNMVGLDHVVLLKVSTTAAVARISGATRNEMLSAISHAWADGHSLRVYRHAPNTCERKNWAAADAAERAVRLVSMARRGEAGIPTVLTTPQYGFYDVLFAHTNKGLKLKPENERVFRFPRPYGTYIIENVMFKVGYPVEGHAQTACEACIILQPHVGDRLGDIDHIEIMTTEPSIRVISKQGPLNNPADRDHCLQYAVAVALAFGELTAESYTDQFHERNPIIDELREKMVVVEDESYTKDYFDPDKRSVANAVQVFFKDVSSSEKIEIHYPLGHPRRREEATPLIETKFRSNVSTGLSNDRCDELIALIKNQTKLENMAVDTFMELLVP